jgi:conjugal transfer pilus assembly protein TrbC
MRRLHLLVGLAAALCVAAGLYAQTQPTSPDPDKKSKEIRARNEALLDEAARRLAIPRGEVNPRLQRGGSVDLSPEKLSEMYEAVRTGRRPGETKAEDVMLFVSVSMPPEALRRLAVQARKAGIPMVFRGLLYGLGGGNTEKSIRALRPVTEVGAKAVIHPVLFERFGVTQVPVLVVTGGRKEGCEETECSLPPVSVLGDASLDYLLAQVSDRKDAYGMAARAALRRLGKEN